MQVKVVGIEGTFDQLWILARFEEAYLRELSSQGGAGNLGSKSTQRSVSGQFNGSLNC